MLGPPNSLVTVSAFDPSYGSKEFPSATVGTVWTDPNNGESYLLVIHNAIYIGDSLSHTLLNPNQMRCNGVRVDDCPPQFDSRSLHAIVVSDPKVTIPMELSGVISYFLSRKPTLQDLEQLERITLTGTAPWNPNAPLPIEDIPFKASAVDVSDPYGDSRLISAVKINELIPIDVSQPSDDTLHKALIQSVNVCLDEDLESTVAAFNISVVKQADEDVLFQPEPEPDAAVASVQAKQSKPTITPEQLARQWNIGLDTAKRTLKVTTQAGLRNIYIPSDRKTRLKAPWLKFPSINTRMYSDALFSSVPSIHKAKGAVVFTDGKGFDSFYPFKSKSQYPETLMEFIHDYGVPKQLVTDGANEMQQSKGRAIANEYHIDLKVTVPYSPWQNKAESTVRELKRVTRRKIHEKKAPKRMWSYAGKWAAALRRLTALDIPELDGRTPHEHVTGGTPDITTYTLFDWYDPVYFHMPVATYPYQKKSVGRLLGVADNCTDELAYIVLPKSGRPVVRKSVWGIPKEALASDWTSEAADLIELDKAIEDLYGDQTLRAAQKRGDSATTEAPEIHDPHPDDVFPEPPPDVFEGDENDPLAANDTDSDKILEADLFTPETMDKYLGAELLLPHGDGMRRARVTARHKDDDGHPLGRAHPNPILDSRLYDIQYPDGSTDIVNANLIAENLYAQVDNEGREHAILKEIVDHRFTEDAVDEADGFVTSANGQRRPVITTKGCDLQVKSVDGSLDWIPLKDLKASNPIEVAEYAVAHKLDHKPCFNWWARKTLRKRARIIKKVKSRYWKTSHKFGIELPHSVAEALAIDARTGTTFWADAIAKEMKNVGVAFEFMEDGKLPVGHKEIKCHMVFDIKRDLTRKARFCAGGNMTEEPKESVFSSVVTRDTVRIAFLYAALNDLDILGADIQNAYLNAPTKEKCWFRAGLEFGQDNVGKPVRIVRALYGLRSSGARWHDHMAATLRLGRFKASYADPDLWMRKQCKPDGTYYWEYVLCYVDDVLVISHNPKSVMNFLNTHYTLKPASVMEPKDYIGAEIRKYRIGHDHAWAASSDTYIKRAIDNVERELKWVNQTLSKKANTPLSNGYRPELDQSPELDAKRTNYYQGLIGVLRWSVELGRIDIMVAVSMLSRYLVNPREGHLEEVFHIFAYLKSHRKSALVFDPTTPLFDESRFSTRDWSEFYPDAKEETPPRAPELLGKSMVMTCFVDADHAGCRETRRSHTGIMIFLQKAPIVWYSKRQNTVESSTFGSEFVAMKTAIEQVEALRYKCRMMGIPIDGPTNVFCDNEAVFKNSTMPESTLKKKHNSIAYHRTREAVAAGIVRIAWEDGRFNLADVLTKLLPGPRLKQLISCILS